MGSARIVAEERGPRYSLIGHEGAVRCIEFNEGGTYCLTGGSDRSVRLWNPKRGALVNTYMGAHAHEVRGVACTSSNDRFASCGGDRQVFLHDVGTGAVVRKFRGHEAKNVNAVSFSRQAGDQVLFSGGFDATCRAWDCRSNSVEPIQVLRDFRDSVTSLAASGYDVIAGSVDGTVRSYDVRTGKAVTDTFSGASSPPVTSVSLSSDSQCILVGVLNSRVGLLDRASGELLAQYHGHKNEEFKVDSMLTNDDAYVVSGSEDGKVYFWDLVEAEVVQTFEVNRNGAALAALAWHPEGEVLLTAATKGEIHVWACVQ
ncbi:WD40 repeat domain-containing protein [Chloropicon primus]|uniref:WD40 repeat domain-containing protein n=1 Tax=Chloropicon primus TaxID=1764295 RepID=A0A5B8MJ28_9CHLO|nr:WD40 repeat domain-containing protein [Chloropicon primus]UPQ99716.1 WD40 repeat domain-containing protein [Chloropicon primus]|eukprot:QDZ20506.1 WD40 repeat domain-containing protein [Chloropicon primus]